MLKELHGVGSFACQSRARERLLEQAEVEAP